MQKQVSSAMYTVQGMRKFVCERLTEAAQEILGAFEKRAQEYELELARQRRQLESAFSPELKRTDLGLQIKEEQHDISISEIQQPNASTSVHGLNSELQSSGPVLVQSTADRKQQEQASTPNQEASKPSSHPSEHNDTDDQTIMINSNATPTKHAHSHKKCSHGYRLPKSCEPKQCNTNKKNNKLSSNEKTEPPLMEIIEIIELCDNSPTSDDVEIIQFDNESGSKQNDNRETTDRTSKKVLHKKSKQTVEREDQLSSRTHNHKSKLTKNDNPQCSHTLTQDANQQHNDDNLNIATISSNMENASTANGKPSTCSNVFSECSEPTQSGHNILSEDVIQNERSFSEESTEFKSNDKTLQGISEDAKFVSRNKRSNNGNLNPAEQSPNKAHKSKSGKKKSLRHSQDVSLDDNNNMGNALFIDTSSTCSNIPSDCWEQAGCEEYITLSEVEVTHADEPLCKNSTGAIKTNASLHGKNEELEKEFNNITFPGSQSTGSENFNADNGTEPALSGRHNDKLRISDESTGQTEMNMDSNENSSSISIKRQNDEGTESYVSNEQPISKRKCEENVKISSANQDTPESSHEYNSASQILITAGQENQPSKKTSNPLQCDLCGKVLANFKNYKSHMKSHTVEKSFKCETCGKMFREGWHLNKHVIIHKAEKPFKCTTCERGFNRRSNFDLHMRIHTGEKPYACGSCEKAFTSRVNLKKHERTHTGEKPYTCDHCKKEFADCSSFRNHQRVHTGEKPYKCSWCKKRFATRTTLKRHLRIHTGEKPYKCSVCEKGFATNTDMKVHFRIHTGERPYKCNNCGQTFSCWTNYNRHQNVHKQSEPKTTDSLLE